VCVCVWVWVCVCVCGCGCELPLRAFYVRSFNNICAKHEISGFHSVNVRILVFWNGTLSSRVTDSRRFERTSGINKPDSVNYPEDQSSMRSDLFSISQVSLQLICEVNKHLLAANEGCMDFRLRNGCEANHNWLYKTLCRLILIIIWCSIRGLWAPKSNQSLLAETTFRCPPWVCLPRQISQKYVHRQHKWF
jgi:hypothetical protein